MQQSSCIADLKQESKLVPASKIYQSYKKNKRIVMKTPMNKSNYLSQKYGANIYLKREDMQDIRSFKIRGAATAFTRLTNEDRLRGVVTASAGNHAQGVAYCCNRLKIKGTIFMPSITPKIKLSKVKHHGGEFLDIVLTGYNFDDAVSQARKFQKESNAVFIHAFDDINVIEGQGGLAAQILEDWPSDYDLDFVFTCVGGGGLASGLGSYLSQMSPDTTLVGFEPLGSPSMYNSLLKGEPVTLESIDTFVDGASMKQTGKIPFQILHELNLRVVLVPQGLVSKAMIQIYDSQAIVLEPAGVLSLAGLELLKDQIKGKNIVCILSGSNNDISRLPEIRLRARIYQIKEAYYIVSSNNLTNIRILVEQLVDPNQQQILVLNTSKSIAGGQCLIGLEFVQPQHKKRFEARALQHKYTLNELKANDPLIRIIV